jgi:hypothetical protein
LCQKSLSTAIFKKDVPAHTYLVHVARSVGTQCDNLLELMMIGAKSQKLPAIE